MTWYTVTVHMTNNYSIEADTPEEAERLVQRELPEGAIVDGMKAEEE